MFARIDELPRGAIGYEAKGRIGLHDERLVIDAGIASARAAGGKVKLLYVAGDAFEGYENGALFDDAVFGSRHFADFERIAFVADEGPYDRAARAMEGLMPAALRIFPTREIEAAKAWLAE